MQALTNQKSRTVSSWLLIGLNLYERIRINQKRSHFWALAVKKWSVAKTFPYCTRTEQTIECFHMTSQRPYWCPRTMKRRPCWCPKPVPRVLNAFFMQALPFVPINLHRCWPRERKRSIPTYASLSLSVKMANPYNGMTYVANFKETRTLWKPTLIQT